MPRAQTSFVDDPRDLAEFILNWEGYRGIAVDALQALQDDSRQAMVLCWLIRLADRVGPHDIASYDPRTGVEMPRGSHWP